MFVASFAGAHHAAVNINADKVFVKVGDHHAKHKLMKCMLLLKKHKTCDEATDAVLEKIDEKCDKYSIDEKKCHHMKKMAAIKIHHCFMAKEFFKEFMGKGDQEAAAKTEAK